MLALFLLAKFHRGRWQGRNPSGVHLDYSSTAQYQLTVSLMEQNRKAQSLDRFGSIDLPWQRPFFLFPPGVIGAGMEQKQMFILDILKPFRELKKWLDYFGFYMRRQCFSNWFFNEKKIIMQDIWRLYRFWGIFVL